MGIEEYFNQLYTKEKYTAGNPGNIKITPIFLLY